ncbi:hypothetical protein GT037_000109 [Alternaria burnsii]|uniref:Uncharacterized protein n=1 Tax=Alternaria burnsii TaxID=1187904 RepID=A0A8H7BFT8_9PLEO|nr:uncharacterized protein GT037_000109 [Alternaria burnsii]KAF7681133.1 hypothetical protein GT037_000109 [Alternaria burnsii]
MKFLATIILLTFFAAMIIAGDCMKAPFQCKGVGKSRLIANIPGFEEFDDSYSSIKCAQVDCRRTCQRSLESCHVLCGGDEDLPRCAVGVSPLPPGRHNIVHTIPTNYTTTHLSKNNTQPPIRVV